MKDKEICNLNSLFDEDKSGELLFHYTSLSSAIAILSTHSLLFSQKGKLNDMDETWRPIQCTCLTDNITDICDKELSSYVQISLTCDDNPKGEVLRRGFDIATMWGHYADRGNGVCIVFNKNRFLCEISNIQECFHGYVDYSENYDCAVRFESSDPENEIKRRIKEIFFCKPDQWRHEQEYRILKKSAEVVDYIDISRCVVGIIYAKLGASISESVCNTKGYWALQKVCGDIPLFQYVSRDIAGNRSITLCNKEIWSTREIIDLESGDWRVDDTWFNGES